MDGDLTVAQFNSPRGIAISKDSDELFVADYGNNAIRRISYGVVDTIAKSVTAPVSITIVSGNSMNPMGLYVTLESGTIVLINNQAPNDNCKNAVKMGTLSPVTPLSVTGTTAKATSDVNSKCGTVTPRYSVWYTFVGNGNAANISTCETTGGSYAFLYVYRDASPHSQSCDDLFCYGPGSLCEFNSYGNTIQICTEAGVTYYIVVDGKYANILGSFELTVTDVGLPATCQDCSCVGIQCGPNSCGGYCTDYECPSGVCDNGVCVVDAVNAECTGAISIPSTNVTLDTVYYGESTVASVVHAAGTCEAVRYPGLWYTVVGTGYRMKVSTCSTSTSFTPHIHVYEQGSLACDKGLFCIAYSSYDNCSSGRGSLTTFCGREGVTYYILIEAGSPTPKTSNERFQLSLTVSENPCTN